jgi:hypothetical protein
VRPREGAGAEVAALMVGLHRSSHPKLPTLLHQWWRLRPAPLLSRSPVQVPAASGCKRQPRPQPRLVRLGPADPPSRPPPRRHDPFPSLQEDAALPGRRFRLL